MGILADYGNRSGVKLAVEPVNRYEIDFINDCDEAGRLLSRLDRPDLVLMPDLFHMNIEDPSIEGSLHKHAGRIGYIHCADSNRHAPGRGHLDFSSIAATLTAIGYRGYVTAEILPIPDPDTAAGEAAVFLKGPFPKSSVSRHANIE